MKVIFGVFLGFFLVFQVGGEEFRDGGLVETQIFLLDSYLPAAMQIIAHLTENMKYDLKPVKPTSTPGYFKPTSTHKPGLYAPENPPGAGQFVQKVVEIQQETLVDNPRMVRTELRVENGEEIPENLENLIGENAANLIKYINSPLNASFEIAEEERVQEFSDNFNDFQRKVPPTRAYVTLLSLYDLLSKDAKKQGLNKFQGYHETTLIELAKTSEGTSADQLKFVLEKILLNRDVTQPGTKKKVETLLEDLNDGNSYLNKAIVDIPPLQFKL